ncbi:MAG: hypothetical protein IJM39_00260 [Firmicutes bacterium]|nr:hypothetical protein [Bacillota bacterium]
MGMNVAIFVIAIVLSIVIGMKLKTNIGLIALAFAFICGPFLWGIGPSKVINYFPVSTFLMIFCGTYFYGFAIDNGTFKNIAGKILWKFRNKTKIMPIILYITAVLVCFLGANSGSCCIFFSPIVFSILTEMGVNPLMGVFIVYCGATGGSMMPWTSDFARKEAMWVPQFGDSAHGVMSAYSVFQFVFMTIAVLVVFFITKSYKGRAAVSITEPEPLNKKQKQNLVIIVIFSLALLLPPIIGMLVPNKICKFLQSNVTIYVLSTVGAVVCHALKLGDIDTIVTKRIPWKSMWIVAGMGTLMGMANDIGVTEVIGKFMGESIPKWLVPAVLVICCGLLSSVVHGAVVQPMMNSFVPILAGVSGANIFGLAFCVQAALSLSGISQFSAGGNVAVVGCTDDKVKAKLVMPQFYTSLIFIAVIAVLAAVGFFDMIGGLLGPGTEFITQ